MPSETHRPYKCPTCPKKFPRKQNLSTHILSHTGYQRYECHICHKKFVYRAQFKDHMNVHNGIRPHKCNLCQKSFLRSGELKSHINSTIHAGIKPFKCTLCKKRFAQDAHLKAHIRSHTGDKPHKCPLCSKSFTQSSHLNSHMLHHTGEKPHQCKICKLRYRLKTTLNSHMRTHTGDRPYKCPQCPRAFTQHTPLTEHILKEHGNERHPCSGCYKEFPTKTQLQRHEKQSHSGVYTHYCLFCGKGQNSWSLLVLHYRRHTQERPYFCQFCEQSFPSSGEVSRHEKTHKKRRTGLKKKTPAGETLPKENGTRESGGDRERSLSPPLLFKEQESKSSEVTPKDATKVNGHENGDQLKGKEVNDENVENSLKLNGICNGGDDDRAPPSPPVSDLEDSVSDSLSPPSLDLEGPQDDTEMEEKPRSKGISSGVDGPFKCLECNKTFEFQAQLNGHIWVHRRKKRIRIRLTLRKKSVPSKSTTSKPLHVKPAASSLRNAPPVAPKSPKTTPIKTEGIGIPANNYKSPTKAIKMELSSPPSKMPSPKNEEEARKLRILRAQKRREMERPFKCDQCQHSFSCESSLELHVQMVHMEVQCHSCPQCWKSFPTAFKLNAHLASEHLKVIKKKPDKLPQNKTEDLLTTSTAVNSDSTIDLIAE